MMRSQVKIKDLQEAIEDVFIPYKHGAWLCGSGLAGGPDSANGHTHTAQPETAN